MRYDDFDDYNSSRSSRPSSRRGSSSSRDYYRDSSYDRGYDRSYDRDYDRSYDRGYDRSYDRDYYRDSRDTSSRYDRYDRYDRRDTGFDRGDWERTAPNWEDHDRKRRSGSGGSRPAPSGNRGRSGGDRPRSSNSGSRPRSQGGQGQRRPSEGQRKKSKSGNQRSSRGNGIQLVPIIVGVVVIILGILIIKALLGGGGKDYSIEFDAQTIVLGETSEARLVGEDVDKDAEVTWNTSDAGIVTVQGSTTTCTLTAKSVGQVTIGALIDGKSVASGTVVVSETAVGVLSIDLADDEVTITAGKTYIINATVRMEDGLTPAKITWSSNDGDVARVSDDGVVTAREVGTAIIRATAGNKTAELVVTVVANPDAENNDPTVGTGDRPDEGAQQPSTGDNTGGNGTTGAGTTPNDDGTTPDSTGDGVLGDGTTE